MLSRLLHKWLTERRRRRFVRMLNLNSTFTKYYTLSQWRKHSKVS